MESLETQIQTFLSIDASTGHGNGYVDGLGYVNDNGNGDGRGYGRGDGDGYDNGNGLRAGHGKGNFNDNGNGNGHGKGYGSGRSYGNGNGDGHGNGDGKGYGTSDGIAEIEGRKVYDIDYTPTIITAVHGNVAQGYLLEKNTFLVPCYIVKEASKFAHGKTLREAYTALQEKSYNYSTEEERIAAFMKKFPDYDTPYDNVDLFAYHHVLTGSCRMGRENFVKNHGLSLDGKTTVRQFVALTKYSYGGEVIIKLKDAYDGR